ncbi:zinc finger protein 706 isoform X1 [Callorhinus ursinus]|uniref:zinc finger protein 706 isoform X1 n=1 Tax=Callorhinus ursinus TaxID=34884 RepID=UPI003CD0271F
MPCHVPGVQIKRLQSFRSSVWWNYLLSHPSSNLILATSLKDMARGQQKIQSQQKNAKKQAGQKKKQGHDQKAAAKAALIYTCTVCRTQMPDPKTFKQHFESKHPKTPLPPELADVQA